MYPNQPAPAAYPYPAAPVAPAAPQPYPYGAPAAPQPMPSYQVPPAAPAYQVPQAPAAPAVQAPIQLPQGGIGGPASTNDPSITRPQMKDLVGRLLLIRPTKREENVPSAFKNSDGSPGAPGPRLTADVIVLDGPPFPYGGDLEKGKPHTHMATQIPFEIPALFIRQGVLIDQLSPALTPGNAPMVCGRLGKVPSTKGSAAYKLADAEPAERELANQYVAARQTGAPYSAAPAAPQAPVYSAPPAPQAAPYGAYTAPAPQAPPAAYVPQAPAQPAYAPVPPAAVPAPQYQVPAGMDPNTWATYTPEQQLSVWQQITSAQPTH